MKLVMLVANTFESDARVHRTASTLAAWGAEVTLVARHRSGLPARERISGYDVVRVGASVPGAVRSGGRALRRLGGVRNARVLQPLLAPLDFRRRQLRLFAFTELVRKYVRTAQPDWIHAHDFPCLYAAHAVWKDSGTPFVYDSHELWTERNRLDTFVSGRERRWEMTAEREAIRRAAFSITVCDSIADHLAALHDVMRPIVIRNTPERRDPARPPRALRAKLGIHPSDFLLVYLGKVTKHRGLTDILHALARLDRRFKFATVGYIDPRFNGEYQRLIDRLKVRDRVFAFGPVPIEDVTSWIAEADLSLTTMNRVCLSYTYALPNKLLESLQAELPVIGPDSPEIAKILSTYRCGHLYADGNGRDLAEKIAALAVAPAELERLRRGAAAAARDLCWENEQQKLRVAYAQHAGLR